MLRLVFNPWLSRIKKLKVLKNHLWTKKSRCYRMLKMIRETSDASLQAYKPRPGVGIGVIVTNKDYPGCVILGKRKGKVGGGLYQLPGGHLEFGETWEDAACRETLEETGIHMKNVKFCHVVNTVVPDIDYHYITIFMKGEVGDCGPSEPENLEPHKCEGWQWIRWEDIPEGQQLFFSLRDFRALNINPFNI